MFVSAALAQTSAAPGSGFDITSIMPLVLIFIVFYFLLIRPQQKRAKEHQAMLSKLAAGDEVATAGGILAKVVEVGEAFVTLEIADGVHIKVQRGQVTSLVPKGTYKSA